MTAEELCTCCDLPVYSCGKVLEQRKARELCAQIERALDEPGVVAGKHVIPVCPGCRSVVPKGHPIRKSPDGWVGVLCCRGGLDG